MSLKTNPVQSLFLQYHESVMDQNNLSHIHLSCPRSFGTYYNDKQPTEKTNNVDRLYSCKPRAESDSVESCENTHPNRPEIISLPKPKQADDERVVLDTWYIIKPGNTKEKVAFFVAHQCSAGGRASSKVKGTWASDGSKAKRRRRSHDPYKGRSDPLIVKEDLKEDVCLCTKSPQASSAIESSANAEDDYLLSVAELVALVEQRTAMAFQNYSRPCPAGLYSGEPRTTPMAFVLPNQEAQINEKSDLDSSRVAEAVAHIESPNQRDRNVISQNGVGIESGPSILERKANSQHSPGEVRLSFRLSSRDVRTSSEITSRSKLIYVNMGSGGSASEKQSKDKITCDLYQLISPSQNKFPNNMEFLLANAAQKAVSGDSDSNESSKMHLTSDTKEIAEKLDNGYECSSDEKFCPLNGDCIDGFHVDVVVTSMVDHCIFFRKDCINNIQQKTVCLTVKSPMQEALSTTNSDPPPGQLFFHQTQRLEDSCVLEDSLLDSQNINGLGCEHQSGVVGSASKQRTSDASLCRLCRHISHDFLEIRFKIQRLLEPRQYMLLLPDHILVNIFSFLPTHSLAALKCTSHYFKYIIEAYDIEATDSKWIRDPLYRYDPCKQCKKTYEVGDVSLCRWHPKPYHHDLPYGRSYWMCCRQTDKDVPGCKVGLHDNNWVESCDIHRE